MTVAEKIENAKRRINELEALIEFWDNYNKKSLESTIIKANKV